MTKKSFVVFRDVFPTAAFALIILRPLRRQQVGVKIAILLQKQLFIIELKLSLQELFYTYYFGSNYSSKIQL